MRATRHFGRTLAFGAAFLLSFAAATASAQNYPTKPVTIVVPSSAGGPADVVARLIAERMSQALGQQVVIENVPGAGGTVGMGRVARAAPDGYTLLIHQTGFAIAPALYAKLTFNVEKDFAVAGMVNRGYSLLVGRGNLPANNFAELVEWMRGPGKPARFGHPGMGTFGHLQTTLLVRAMSPDANMIPYRGVAPAINDALGGHIDLVQASAAAVGPHVQAGKLKLFAHASPTRLAAFPDAPSYAEVLYKELARPLWHAIFAPAGTPQPVLERINAAIRTTLADARVQKTFAASHVEPFPEEFQSLEASQKYVRDEIAFWGQVVRDNNIKAD
jgi:tripartite-type tricarboxylate transporter receptor subunit TctC